MMITVTGGRGFVGSHLIPALKARTHTIRSSFDLKEGNDIFTEVLDYAIWQSDVVVHLAAKTIVNESFIDPLEYYRTNILGTARVIDRCLEHGKKLIYFSSASVKNKYSSPYAMSKYLAEEIFEPFMDLMNITVLRPENIYGPGMKRGTLLYNFLHNKELIVDGNGEQSRDYIHIDDVVNIVVKAVESDWKGRIIPIGTGVPMKVRQIADLVNQLTGKPIIYKKDNSVGVMSSVADITELKKVYQGEFKNLYDYIKEECDK